MAKGGGGTRLSTKKITIETSETYNDKIGVDIQSIKTGLLSYARVDRWNNNSAYQAGFNDSALSLIEELSNGDYGLASEIAKQAVNRPNFDKYGVSLSEKQAYVLAKAAYDNKVLKSNHIIFDKTIIEKARQLDARQKAARHARSERRKERDNAVAAKNNLKPLSKGVRIPSGSSVYDKSGNSYVVTERKGDLFTVKDKNGKVTRIHKSKIYTKE